MIKKNPYTNPRSISYQFRLKRFQYINPVIEQIIEDKGFCRVLDLGGTAYYWNINRPFLEKHKNKISFTLLNLQPEQAKTEEEIFTVQAGDVTDAAIYKNGAYDYIHSNSVIEHLRLWPAMRKMANLILESRKPFFVQTPSYWFPIEPHFRIIGFQWLPEDVRAWLLMRFDIGFSKKSNDYDDAMRRVEDVKLLTFRQMRELFPGASIKKEQVLGLTKSIMAIGSETTRPHAGLQLPR